MIDFSNGYSKAGMVLNLKVNEVDEKLVEDEFCSLNVSVRKIVSRWNRETLGRNYCFELEEGDFSFLVEYIDKVTSKFGTSIEGYYLERSEEEDEWWHVWVIASRKTNLVTIRINRCPSPHPLTRKRYEQLSEVNNAPL
ncbi:hypothetical protein IKD98_03065 [Candidatus Saccharibacteria bacterium]|nr:hypothetical protein [Candidatus Saccharibacteria bacterium]